MAETTSQGRQTRAVAITGSGGSGAVTTGQILLSAIADSGYYGLMTRSAGPQIRGGESAAMIRYADEPIECMGDTFDIIVGLDWGNVDRFIDEIPLQSDSLILADSASGELPTALDVPGVKVIDSPLKQLAADIDGGRINMVALGVLGSLLDLSLGSLLKAVEQVLGLKGAEVVASSRECIRTGYDQVEEHLLKMEKPSRSSSRWNISGNEACGLGAIRGGVRLVAAYPITPATEVLEWMAPNLEKVGGCLLQAEDELASVNMAIGGSFGGVPSMTATSGPGLSLMTEGIGLAITSETPLVVLDVMRGGPSTGIPTKSEQSDLNIALYGFHGDAPHLVLAAVDIRDCAFTTQWAVRLAEHLQTVAIVLSDQSLGQARAIIDPPSTFDSELERVQYQSAGDAYQRYAITTDGISPMAIPGAKDGMYTGDGLEHTPAGIPSSLNHDHEQQSEKRLHKLLDFDYGDHWLVERGEGDTVLLTWGSAFGAAVEAAERLSRTGRPTRVIALRLLAPLRADALRERLEACDACLVIEQNQSGQCFHYLRSHDVLPAHARSFGHAGPLAIRPGEIIAALLEE